MREAWDDLVVRTARGEHEAEAKLIELSHASDDAHAALIREAANAPTLPPPGLFDGPLPDRYAIPEALRDRWARLCDGLWTLGPQDSPLVDALNRLLSRWPAEVRGVPYAWHDLLYDPRVEHPALRLFRRLDYDFNQGALHHTPHMRHITHLFMEGVDAPADAWAELATSPHLGQLKVLNCCGAVEGASMPLVLAPSLNRLTGLDLASCELEDHHMVALANAPNLATLHVLNLGMNPDWNGQYFGAAGLTALATSPHLTRLRTLDLNLNEHQDAATWQTLFHAPNLRHLQRLILDHYIMDLDGLRALTSSPHLGALERLFLGALSDLDTLYPIADVLQTADNLGALRELYGEGFPKLADALIGHPALPALERVEAPPY